MVFLVDVLDPFKTVQNGSRSLYMDCELVSSFLCSAGIKKSSLHQHESHVL